MLDTQHDKTGRCLIQAPQLAPTLQISSVQDVDPRSHVLDQPVESLEKPLSCVSAAAHNLPVPAAVHHFQIQNLKGRKVSQVCRGKNYNEFRWRTALSAFAAQTH